MVEEWFIMFYFYFQLSNPVWKHLWSGTVTLVAYIGSIWWIQSIMSVATMEPNWELIFYMRNIHIELF